MRDKNVPMRLKRKAFNESILPVMIYGCETWWLSNTQLKKLVTTQRKIERIMVGVTLKVRKSTNWIQKQRGVTEIIRNLRESQHRWADTSQGDMTTDGQSESQNGPVDIKDLEADLEGDGATA